MKLTNNHSRTLGVPGRNESIILDSGSSVDINEDDLKAIYANATSSLWVEQGLLSVDGEKEETADAATVKHVGGGRWNVFVHDEQLSDETLSKEEAEALAVEYNASGN